MLQPVLQVEAKLHLVLSAVEFEVFEQALLMISEELGDLGLVQELTDLSGKLALLVTVSLVLFDLLLERCCFPPLLLRLLLLSLLVCLALIRHGLELVVHLLLLLPEELTLLSLLFARLLRLVFRLFLLLLFKLFRIVLLFLCSNLSDAV